MNVKRIFDFSALALEKFPKEDCLVTKKNGKWVKTSTMEFVNQGNKISRGLLKLGINLWVMVHLKFFLILIVLGFLMEFLILLI